MEKEYKNGDLRVWWVPQFPMDPFTVDVSSVEEAKLVLDTLGRYDIFQFENNVKPDYANAGGLWVFEGVDWEEWVNEEGDCIDDAMVADLDLATSNSSVGQ